MLHYKACARTRKQKAADIALMVFGLVAAAYTTIQTVRVSEFPFIFYVSIPIALSVSRFSSFSYSVPSSFVSYRVSGCYCGPSC